MTTQREVESSCRFTKRNCWSTCVKHVGVIRVDDNNPAGGSSYRMESDHLTRFSASSSDVGLSATLGITQWKGRPKFTLAKS